MVLISKVLIIFSDEKRHGESDERTKLPKSQTALRWYGNYLETIKLIYNFYTEILKNI